MKIYQFFFFLIFCQNVYSAGNLFKTFRDVEVSGITDNGMDASKYTLESTDASNGLKRYKGKTFADVASESVLFLKKDNKIQVIEEMTTGKGTLYGGSGPYTTTTSAFYQDGKLVSQLNCENLSYYSSVSGGSNSVGCQAMTEKLCDTILKNSGKKTFQEIITTHSQICEPLENSYYDALSNSEVQKSIQQAYKDHKMIQNAVFSEDSPKYNNIKVLWTNNADSIYLNKSKSISKPQGLPMIEVIKQCDYYLTMGIFKGRSVTTAQSGQAAPAAAAK